MKFNKGDRFLYTAEDSSYNGLEGVITGINSEESCQVTLYESDGSIAVSGNADLKHFQQIHNRNGANS